MKLRFFIIIIVTMFSSTFVMGENYTCTDELRTGIFKEKEKWTSKEIRKLKFTVKLEGIKINFKVDGEDSFSGCNDFKYDKFTDIYQCSNFAKGWGEPENIYYEIFSFSPSRLRFSWSYLPGYILDKKGNSPMVGGGTCSASIPTEKDAISGAELIARGS